MARDYCSSLGLPLDYEELRNPEANTLNIAPLIGQQFRLGIPGQELIGQQDS